MRRCGYTHSGYQCDGSPGAPGRSQFWGGSQNAIFRSAARRTALRGRPKRAVSAARQKFDRSLDFTSTPQGAVHVTDMRINSARTKLIIDRKLKGVEAPD